MWRKILAARFYIAAQQVKICACRTLASQHNELVEIINIYITTSTYMYVKDLHLQGCDADIKISK